MSMTRKEQARVLLNLRGVDPAKWTSEEVRRLFDLISSVAYEEPKAGVPAGMVLDANRIKWFKAAAEFLDYCAGTDLEFEGCEHSALAIVDGLHEALFDDEMDTPFHEAVAWCLDHAKQATPTDEAASQGWQPIETAPKDETRILLWSTMFGGRAIGGRWNTDRYAKRPRPFWDTDGQLGGKDAHRVRHATHWQPLPETPAAARSAPGSGVVSSDA